MLNNCVFVGVLSEEPTEKETLNGNKYTSILLNVRRPFKNSAGEYEDDIIRLTVWKSDASKILEYVKVGSVLAVKGRVQSSKYEKDGKTYLNYEFYGEKVTLVSSQA